MGNKPLSAPFLSDKQKEEDFESLLTEEDDIRILNENQINIIDQNSITIQSSLNNSNNSNNSNNKETVSRVKKLFSSFNKNENDNKNNNNNNNKNNKIIKARYYKIELVDQNIDPRQARRIAKALRHDCRGIY